MRWRARGAALASMLLASACQKTPRDSSQGAAADASAEAERLCYPDVADVFAEHCDRCHHRSQSDDEDAMAVFESSSYPFETQRPETLLEDLRDMFEDRSGLSEDERRRALRWLDDGALDAEGNPPPY